MVVGLMLAPGRPNVVKAGQPTMTFVATALNFQPLKEGPTREITVLPGDRFTAELQIRDWSPNGEQLTAYQAQLEPIGFTTGPRGFIEPILYSETRHKETDNAPNMFVDKKRPDYIYKDLDQGIAIVDSRSEGYRWMGVMLNNAGPVCTEPGKPFYGGTVHFMVSDNAAGTFKLPFMEGIDYTLMLKTNGEQLADPVLEELKVHVLRPTDAGFWPGLLERLNSHWFTTVQPADHEFQDRRTVPRFAALIKALNESRRSAKPEKAPTATKE